MGEATCGQDLKDDAEEAGEEDDKEQLVLKLGCVCDALTLFGKASGSYWEGGSKDTDRRTTRSEIGDPVAGIKVGATS